MADSTVTITHLQNTRKVFTRWMNFHLRVLGLAVDDCVSALRTGIVLAQLVDALTGESSLASSSALRKGTLDSLDRASRVHNVHHVLMYLGSSSGLSLTAIDAEAFVDGKTAIVLQFIWSLIVEYEVRPLTGLSRIKSVAQICRALNRLVADVLEGYSVVPLDSFPANFKSGLPLAALFHKYDYKLVDFYTLVRTRASRDAVFAAVRPLLESLDCPLFLDPEEFDSLDDSLFVVFFCPFWKAYSALPPRDEGSESSPGSTASGLRKKLNDAYAKNAKLESMLADARAEIATMQDTLESVQTSASHTVERKEDQLKLASQDVRQLEMVVMDLKADLAHARQTAEDTARALQDTLLLERQRAMAAQEQSVEAPSGRVYLVYVDIESALQLWEGAPKIMSDALLLYNAQLSTAVRVHRGYVVRTEGDAILIAFDSVVNAATFALVHQLSLLDANWPGKLLDLPSANVETGLTDDILFRGLRAAIGIHAGNPVRQKDATTGRVDFIGPIATLTTLLGSTANGGQILMSDEAFQDLESRLFELRVSPVVTPLGVLSITSASRSLNLFQLLPERLADRRFKGLRSTGDGRGGGGETGDGTGSSDPVGVMTATERKMMLLQDRNTKFTNKLMSLSEEVETASSSARKLVRALSRIQYSTSGEVSKVMQEFMDELEAVTNTQKHLNEKLTKTVADNEQFASHLTGLEAAFMEEMEAARRRMREHEREAKSFQARSIESHASISFKDPQLDAQIASLKELHETHKRKTRATEVKLRGELRSTKAVVKKLRAALDVAEFKLKHEMMPDPAENLSLDLILTGPLRSQSEKNIRKVPVRANRPSFPSLDHSLRVFPVLPGLSVTSPLEDGEGGGKGRWIRRQRDNRETRG